jgi:hypothetical protein
MRLITLSLLFVFALSGLLPAQDGEKVTIEWKFKKGDSFRYEMSQNTEMDMAGMEITQEMVFGSSWDVQDVTADGVATIKSTYDRIKMKMSGPLSADYDSSKDKKPAEGEWLSGIFAGFLDKSITFQMNKKGEVLKVEGITKLIEAAIAALPEEQQGFAGMMKQYMNDDTFKGQMQLLLPILPKEPVAKGATWEGGTSVGMGGLGKADMKSKSTLKDVREGGKEAVVGVESKFTFKEGEGGMGGMEVTESKMKGEIVWSLEKGLLQSMKGTLNADGTGGGGEMSVSQKMEIKLVPKATTTK